MASLFLVGAKKQALDAILISGNTYKVALFNASYDNTTAAYGTTNEVTGTGWGAGGKTLTGLSTATSGTTAFGDFADVSEPGVTVTGVRFIVIYDDTDNDEVRAVFDLGSDFAVTAGTLGITWPAADASNAIIRIA
jgi:hypothetical protein